MSLKTKMIDELDALKAKFAALLGHEVPAVQQVASDAIKDVEKLKSTVEADAGSLGQDAEKAAEPVLSQAEHDGEAVASDAGKDAAEIAESAADAAKPASGE